MRRLTMILALALVVAACGSDDDVGGEDPSGPEEAQPDVEETVALAEAVTKSDGPVQVTGQLLITADGAVVLCAGLTRSIPPQCAGSRLTVEDLDLDSVQWTGMAGVSWTAGPVTLEGEKLGGVLFAPSLVG